MDVYRISETRMVRVDALSNPSSTSAQKSFLWLDATHDEVDGHAEAWRDEVARLTGMRILEPHLIDAVNLGHPSYFDSTQDYEMVVFRKLSVGETVDESGRRVSITRSVPLRQVKDLPEITRIGTKPVTFFLCDRALVTVRAMRSRTIEQVRSRLLDYRARPADGKTAAIAERDPANEGFEVNGGAGEGIGSAAYQGRPPSRPEELMLRLLNAMVDRYLELRQPLTDQLDRWQRELLDPHRSFSDWRALLEARIELRKLENLCEEQRDALQELRDHLVDTMENAPEGRVDKEGQRRNDVLMVRINDVMEHVSRVLHHARRLQDSVESAIQLHFSATAHRTNEIVRMLTIITAIFAPLTLLTGIFGMNFHQMPLLDDPWGFWLTMVVMALVATGLLFYFRRSRIIERKPDRNVGVGRQR